MQFQTDFAFLTKMVNLSRDILREPTCHGQLKCAEVTAKLVAGRDHQLTSVGALDPLEPQGVLIVVWHAHLVGSWFADQHHSPPEENPDKGFT